MRPLSGTLLAAQKAASSVPYVRIIARNRIRGVLHAVFTQTFSDGAADVPHGAVADTTYLHRVRVSGGNAQYERNAGTGWTTLSSAADVTHVAIAAVNNTRVMVVYDRGGTLYFRESTNQGTSFSAEAVVAVTGGTNSALSVAYKNSGGDCAVVFAETPDVARVRRTSGTWGFVAIWTNAVATINGLAMLFGPDYHIILTGTEITTLRPTLWAFKLGDGFFVALDTWTPLRAQAQGEADADNVTFQAPSIAAVADGTRILFVEKYTGTPAYTRTYRTGVPAAINFPVAFFECLDPAPLNNTTNEGYAITQGKTPQQMIYSRPAQVLEAPTASVELDMSPDLLDASIDIEETTLRATLIFDNTNNQYAGPPDPIRLNRTVDIGLGYGAEYSYATPGTIVGWEHVRDGGNLRFHLHLRGHDHWLARSRSRSTTVENASLANIMRASCGRAGLERLNVGVSARSNALVIEWVTNPQDDQLTILRALTALMSDVLIAFGGTGPFLLTLSNPAAADAIDYTYGTDHAILKSTYRADQAAGLSEILAPTRLGSAYDYAVIDHDKPLQDRRRSPHDTSTAEADDHAAARLRKAQLEKNLGELITPPNCGLELIDVVAFTDAAVSPSQLKARVTAIRTIFKRAPTGGAAVYRQHLTLGGL